MRQVFSRLVVASGLLLLACATAVEDGPLGGDIGEEQGGSTSQAGSVSIAGSTSSAGTLPSAGTTSGAGTTSSSGGKGGSGSTAFGGTSTTGGTKGGSGGSASGGANAGSSSGGKAGSASGGSATAGAGSGGTGMAGSGTAGSGTAGSTSTTCSGVANWSSKTYAIGDTVASVCSGVFAGSCPSGQSHKFECNPGAGAAALPWCQSREPGVGNGWNEAWVDKGQCQ